MLSKSKILSGRQCDKRLWLEVHSPELVEEDASREARFATGHRVGRAAQEQFPDGLLIEGDSLQDSLDLTQAHLADGRPLFEATFRAGGILVRVDILVPAEDGAWRMIEVKGSTKLKPEYLPDCAVQAWVLRQSGLRLASVELAHLDRAFVYPGGGDYEGLFHFEDVTEAIEPLATEVPDWADHFEGVLAGELPGIAVGPQCTDPWECPFISHCTPPGPNYPVSVLYYGRRMAEQLEADGFEDLRDVPEHLLSKEIHIRQLRATVSGKPVLLDGAGEMLASLPYPRHYLDFETLMPAIPLWRGTRPYQQVPFQYSLHIESEDGHIEHRECLALDGDDPRPEVARRLVEDCGDSGPIFMYTKFEIQCIKRLIEATPELEDALNAIIDRMVDLHPMVRDHYYHPDMHGSFSIKKVLPTVAPDLDYADMEGIADGGAAADAAETILDPNLSSAMRDQLVSELLIYCRRDTEAMIRLSQHLRGAGATGDRP